MDDTAVHFGTIWMPPAERDFVSPLPDMTQQAHPESSAQTAWRVPGNNEAAQAARNLVLMVARAAVEALTGYRPIGQLARWLAPAALDGLAMANRHSVWSGAAITHVWAKHMSNHVIEGVAQISLDDHKLALPVRLELHDGRWSCTHLSVILPGSHLLS